MVEKTSKNQLSNQTPTTSIENNHHLPQKEAAEKVDLMNTCPTIVSDAYKKLQAGLSQQDTSLVPGLPKFGPYKYKDGSTYEGQYKDGKRHGFGKQVSPQIFLR